MFANADDGGSTRRPNYERFYAGGGWRYSAWRGKRFLHKRIVRPLGLARGQRVLDLGCGMGFHSHLLAQLGFDVTGIDASAAGIQAAHAAYDRPRFIHMDAAKMSEHFTPAAFDVIYDRGMSWYHYELNGLNKHGVDVPERTRELFRFLRPGGLFILQIMTDFSGRRPSTEVHHNRYDDYVQLFRRFGEIVLVTDWRGRRLASQADAERSGKNVIIATRAPH